MQSIKAQSGQSLIDIAIEHTGSVEGVFDLLALNPQYQRIEDNATEGDTILLPAVVYSRPATDFFRRSAAVSPATAAVMEGYGPLPGGDFDFNDFNNDFA